MREEPSTEFKSKRPAGRPDFERIALLLQGGGALGSYQAGVYQALAEADLHPDWIAGISIGAINSALIAGNPPEKRVDRLREFWVAVTEPPLGIPNFESSLPDEIFYHRLIKQSRALVAVFFGAPNFFKPRLPPPFLGSTKDPSTLSIYDFAPLKALLERLVDFALINSGASRFSVGAVNVRTGNFTYFDNTTHQIGPAHVMASASLPPGFPATKINGDYSWDGALVSNTPLQWVLDSRPRKDTLSFQIDLWCARGELPRDLVEVDLREKDIRFSSRTRAATDQFRKSQALRRAAMKLLAELPETLRHTPEAEMLEQEADDKIYNIIHLIYHAKKYEGTSKDYEFSRATMEEHWTAGYNDAICTLANPEVLKRHRDFDGVFTFDLGRQASE